MPSCVKCGSQKAYWTIMDKDKNNQDYCDDCFKKYNLSEYKKEMDEYHKSKKGTLLHRDNGVKARVETEIDRLRELLNRKIPPTELPNELMKLGYSNFEHTPFGTVCEGKSGRFWFFADSSSGKISQAKYLDIKSNMTLDLFQKVSSFAPKPVVQNEQEARLPGKKLELDRTFPSEGSYLCISPDESKIAWSRSRRSGKYEIVIADSHSFKDIITIESESENIPPEILFTDNDRLLVGSCRPTDDYETHLVLYNCISGQELASIDIEGYLHDCCFSHYKQIVAKEGTFKYLLISTKNDQLNLNTIKTCFSSSGSPPPQFGPDNELYVDEHELYRIDENDKIEISIGGNCFCFYPEGMVSVGGGYSDRSGDSYLFLTELNSGETTKIPWHNIPIDIIMPAGNKNLMVATHSSSSYADAWVSLFSISNNETIWSKKFTGIAPFYDPLLITVPDQGWAVIRDEKFLRRIAIMDGSDLERIPTKYEESLKATWASTRSTLYLERMKSRHDGPYIIECYQV